MKQRVSGVVEPFPIARAGGIGVREPGRAVHTAPFLRVALVLVALVWTQFPLGGGARAEGGRALELCCAWGRSLEDGTLTYSVESDDDASGEVLRSAVREWDEVLSLTLAEVSPRRRADVVVDFIEDGGRTEGQAVTSFTQRGLIRRVEITIKGGRAPANSGGLLQIAKHEFGHAFGLGHATFDGNLMSEAVSPEPSPIPSCAIEGVVEANRWQLVEPRAERPEPPEASRVPC